MADTYLDRLLDSVGGISGYEGTLTDPQWERAGKVHDWRNHIPETVRNVWDAMSLDARVVSYVFAREAAQSEEWD